MAGSLIFPLAEKYRDYLTDESKLAGTAASISFPQSEPEIAEIVARMREKNVPITIQGGKTGIAGGAVPPGGHILNLSKMNRVKRFISTGRGETLLKVEPGITLRELNRELKMLRYEEELCWPPDPTESSATAGGVASCNARGPCSRRYGEAREYVAGAKIALSSGAVLELQRGKTLIPFPGGHIDLLDLFLGGEGLFGIFTELTLKLQPKPKEIWGFTFFFEEKEALFAFADYLVAADLQLESAGLAAAEYIDGATLELIRERKAGFTSLKHIPEIDSTVTASIYLEFHNRQEEAVEEIAEMLMDLALRSNSDPDRAWAVAGEAEVEKLRAFRHAAAECANLFTERVRQEEPRLTKLESYIGLENIDLPAAITKYETDLAAAGLKASIFGHIGENRLHVNLLPVNYLQYEKGRYLLEQWAEEFAGKEGKIETQHGIGKLKKTMFLKMAPGEYIRELQKLKDTYDSIGIWNPENVL
ncbi:MAG: FAD-binding oxidoreductase [Bacillota bacterium]